MTTSRLHNNICPIYNYVMIVSVRQCPLYSQSTSWTLNFYRKMWYLYFFFPHEMTSMAKTRTSYNLLPGLIKDRYWCDRFSWPLLFQKTRTFHILSFDNMPRGRKQIRDVRWWPDSWNVDNTGCWIWIAQKPCWKVVICLKSLLTASLGSSQIFSIGPLGRWSTWRGVAQSDSGARED